MTKFIIALSGLLSTVANADQLACRAHYTLVAEAPCVAIGPLPGPSIPTAPFVSHMASVEAQDDLVRVTAYASKANLSTPPEYATLSVFRKGASVSLATANSTLDSPLGGRLSVNLGEEAVEGAPAVCKYHRFLFFICELQ